MKDTIIKFARILPDKLYLKILYLVFMRKTLNFDKSKTFNELIQYLKIYNRNPEYTLLVDKYEVKKWISQKIGDEYNIPTLGVFDSFEDIKFENLPNSFVMKGTHDSGSVVIVQDKSTMDIKKIKSIFDKSLKENYFYRGREWAYKNVKPRIIIEEMLISENGEIEDYKFNCFHGVVDSVMVCTERSSGKPKFYFFDKKWKLLKYNRASLSLSNEFTIDPPQNIDKMFEIAEVLSKNIPFVRVDLYNIQGRIYFGEMTFYPHGGFDKNLLSETDMLWGEKILRGEKNENNRLTD